MQDEISTAPTQLEPVEVIEPTPQNHKRILKPFLIVGLIEACLPFFAVLFEWVKNSVAGRPDFLAALGMFAYQANVLRSYLTIDQQNALMQSLDPANAANYTIDPNVVLPLFVSAIYPFYLPPLACALIAFLAGLLITRYSKRIGRGVGVSLLAALVYTGSTLVFSIVAFQFIRNAPRLTFPEGTTTTTTVTIEPTLSAPISANFPDILIYTFWVGLAALLLSLIFAWLGGLLGKRFPVSTHGRTPL